MDSANHLQQRPRYVGYSTEQPLHCVNSSFGSKVRL